MQCTNNTLKDMGIESRHPTEMILQQKLQRLSDSPPLSVSMTHKQKLAQV